MSNENIYPDGVRIFHPHKNAPDFVKGTMIVGEDFLKFFQQYAKPSQYGLQIKLNILTPRNTEHGPLNLKLDTWEPQQQQSQPQGRRYEQQSAPPPFKENPQSNKDDAFDVNDESIDIIPF